jgi:hypothetical protein
MIFVKQPMIWPGFASTHVADELRHVDSDLCWCDPIVEFDENEDQFVIHREITWN